LLNVRVTFLPNTDGIISILQNELNIWTQKHYIIAYNNEFTLPIPPK